MRWPLVLILMDAAHEDIVRAHIAYQSESVKASARLRAHLRETDGPLIDGSVESLIAVNLWFQERLVIEANRPGDTNTPAWWGSAPLVDSDSQEAGPFTSQQLAIIDEVQAYLAEVMLANLPGAELAIYSGDDSDWRNGQTAVRYGIHRFEFPVSIAYSVALDVVLYRRPVNAGVLAAAVKTTEAA